MTGIPMDGVDGDRAHSHQCPFFKGADHGNQSKTAFMRDRERRLKRNETTPETFWFTGFQSEGQSRRRKRPCPVQREKNRGRVTLRQ